MKKTIISEQSTPKLTQQRTVDAKGVTHDSLLELAKQYCDGLENFKFHREHPVKGVDALSFQRPDNGFNFIINENDKVTKERYDTSSPAKLLSSVPMEQCQNKISTQIPLPWTDPQFEFLKNFKTKNEDIILEKPAKEIANEYTRIDMSPYDKTLFPDEGVVFSLQTFKD
jgi:hypothetical protein